MTEEIRRLQDQLERNPQDVQAFERLAQLYEASYNWRSLSVLYRRSGESMDEQDARAHLLALTERIKKIIAAIQANQPNDAQKASVGAAMVELGDLYFHRLSMRDEAMLMYQHSFKAWSNDTVCLERARQIYWQDGDFERVLVLLGLEQRVHKKLGKTDALVEAQTLVARVHGDHMDNLSKALDMALEAQALRPEHPAVQALLSRYARDARLKNIIEDTLQKAEELTNTSPLDAAKQLLRASRFEFVRVDGDLDDALLYVDSALDLDPQSADAKAHRELLHQAAERVSQAYEDAQLGGGGQTQVLWAQSPAAAQPDAQPDAQHPAPEQVQAPSDAEPEAQVEAQVDAQPEAQVEDEPHSTEYVLEELSEEDDAAQDAPAQEPAPVQPEGLDVSESSLADERTTIISPDAIGAVVSEDVQEAPEDVEGQEDELGDEDSSEASDAEDSDAEDSDAEDSDAEDSDAEDSDAEDSDAEDSDAEDDAQAPEQEGDGGEDAPQESSLADEETGALEDEVAQADAPPEPDQLVAAQPTAQEQAQAPQPEPAQPIEDHVEATQELPAPEQPVEQAPEPVVEPVVEPPAQTPPVAAQAAAALQEVSDAALEAAQATLKKDPTDLAALAIAQAGLRQRQDLEGLAKQLEHSVKYLRNKDGEFEVMLRVAELFWHELRDMNKAEYYFKRLRYQDGDMPQVLAFYEAFFIESQDWRKLHKHLQDQLKGLEGDEPRERAVVERLAKLSEREMESPEKGIDAWRTFLGRHPGDAQARQELRRLYVTYEKWPQLIEYLRDEIKLMEDDAQRSPADRVALLLEINALYRDRMPGGDLNRIQALTHVLELDAHNRQAFDELRELLGNNRRFNELATLLTEQSDRAVAEGDIARAVELRTEVADLWQERLNNISQAMPALEKILEIDPQHAPTRARLKEIYAARRDYKSLFELLDQETEHQARGGDAALRAHLEQLLELAQDKLRDPDKAVPILNSLLELDPHDVTLYDRLEYIYKRQDDLASMAGVMERKVELPLPDKDLIATASQAAELYERRLEQPERAAALWHKVLKLDAGNAKAFARLTELCIAHRRFDELEALYEQRDALERYFEILRNVAKDSEPAAQAEVYRRMATLSEQKLGDAKRVTQSLEQLLEVSQDKASIARELIGWYRQQGDLAHEVAMRKILLEHAPDDPARFEELRHLSELEIQRENDAEALRWLFEAVRVQPAQLDAVEAAQALAMHLKMLPDFLDHLELIAELHEADPSLQEALWLRVAGLAHQERGDTARAIELYERLRARHPEDPALLRALEQLYELGQRPEDRLGALRDLIRVLQASGEPQAEVVEQLSKIAQVQHRHLAQHEQAQQTYHEILAMDADCVPAIQGLRDLYMAQQSWPEVIQMLSREYELTPLDALSQRVVLRSQLAMIHRDELDDLPKALAYFSDILDEHPDHADTLEQVEGLLEHEVVARDAALKLERLFRDSQEHARLAHALVARHRVCADPYEERELLEELVPLYIDTLGDLEAAFPWACRRFELDPSDEARWDELGRLAQQLDQWVKVEALLSDFAPFSPDGQHAERAELLRRVAHIRETHLADKPRALAAWERLYDFEPDELDVVQALERLYRDLSRWPELVDTLEAKVAMIASPEDQIALLLEAARTSDVALEDVDRAVSLYQRVLTLEPTQPEAVESLIRLFIQEGRFGELDELYTTQAQLDAQGRRDFMLAQATLRAQQRDDAQGALELLVELLQEDVRDAQALEVLVDLDAMLLERDALSALRLEIALELDRIYRALGQDAQLIEVLETRYAFAQDPFERLALLDELAALYLGQQEPGLAFDRTRDAVVLMPDELERRQRLEQLAAGLDRFEDVVQAYADAAQGLDDPFAASPLYKRMGQLLVEALARDEDAIEAYERALAVEEQDVPTLRAVEQLYLRTNKPEQLSKNLKRQAQVAQGQEQAELLRRIGQLEEETLERPVEAIDAYERLREMEPEALDALDALERLYEGQSNWIELTSVLRVKADVLTQPQDQLASLLKLARAFEHKLDDEAEAVLTYQRMRELDPAQLDALEALDALYAKDSRALELSEILRAKLELTDAKHDPTQRATLELRLAKLLADDLRELDEAIGLYLGIFERHPGQPEALEALDRYARDLDFSERVAPALTRYYEGQADWVRLVELKQVQRDLQDDPEAQAQYNWQIARIYYDFMDGQQAEAIEALAEAWRLMPEEARYKQDLIDVVTAERAFARLAEVYEDVLLEVSDLERQKALRVELALVYRDHLQDLVRAEEQFHEALNQDERDVSIYEALQALYMQQERWLDLNQLLQRRFDVFMDEPDAKRFLLQIAMIQDQRVPGGSLDAVATYRRVLDELDPRDETADEEVQRLYRDQENWIDLSDYLNGRLGVWEDEVPRQTEIKKQLAQIYQVHLQEAEQALQLHREVLQVQAQDAQTIASLEQLFEARPFLREDVAQVLEPIYREQLAWTKLIHVLRTKAEAEGDPFAKVELLEEVARVCAQLMEPRDYPQALETYGELLALAPERQDARRQMYRIAERLQAWERLVQIYEHTLLEATGLDDELSAQLYVEQAQLLEERLERLEDARAAYYRVFEFEPAHAHAVESIIRLDMRLQDWIDLGELYEARAEAEFEPEARAAWLERLAVLQIEILEEEERAIDTYKRALDALPGRPNVMHALIRLMRRAEQFEDLSELYLTFIDQLDDQEARQAMQFSRAQLLEVELDRVEEAIDTYRDLLLQRPGHRDCLSALEGMRRDLQGREGHAWDLQIMTIVDLLLEHYNVERDWRRVVDLYLHKQRVMEVPEEGLDLLLEAGSLHERYGEDRSEKAEAILIYARAYSLAPGREDVFARLKALAGDSKESWERIMPSLLQEMEAQEDPEQKARQLNAIARIYRYQIEDARSALGAYEQALHLDPDNEVAMRELESLYGQFEHWDSLVVLLRRRLETTYDGDARVNLLQRIANVQDSVLKNPEEAIRAYEELREQDPSDLTYLEALARHYEQVERDAQLEEVLQAMAALQPEDKRLATLKKLAQVQLDLIQNIDGAIETTRQILQIDEEDEQAVDQLITLYARTSQWYELLEMLTLKREFAAAVEDIDAIELRMGQIQRDHLHQAIDALERFAAIARRSPDHSPSVQAISAMLEDAELHEEAARILEEIHSANERWAALEVVYRKRLERLAEGDPFAQVEAFMRLAALQEDRLSNPQGAFYTHAQALRVMPDDEVVAQSLERLSASLGMAEELVAAYEDALEVGVSDPLARQRLHTRLGELYYDELDQAEPAMGHMEQVLQINEHDPVALDLLDRLYKAHERYEELADVLARKLVVVEPEALTTLRFRLGELRELRFDQAIEALDLYRQVIQEQPDHRGTIEALERMLENHEGLRIDIFDLLEDAYTRTQSHAKLSELFKYKLEVVDAPHERAELLRKIAHLEIQHLDHLQVGFGFMGRALVEDPLDADTQAQLEALAAQVQEPWIYQELLALYEGIIQDLNDPVRRFELALPAAGWAMTLLAEFDRATALYGVVLDFEPQHEQALLALESIARDQGQVSALAEVLRRKVDILNDDAERFAAYAELGQAYAQLERPQDAIDAFNEAWSIQPANVHVMAALVALHDAAGHHDDVADVLERLIQETPEGAEQVALLVRLGTVCAQQLKQTPRAIDALERASAQVQSLPTLRLLEALYEDSGDVVSLSQNLDQQTRLAQTPEDRVRVLVRRAQIAYDQSGDAEAAIAFYQEAFQIHPTHELILSALDGLYRKEHKWMELFNLYYQQLEQTADPARRAELATDLAQLSHDKLSDSNTAVQYIQFALQQNPRHLRALQVLETIYAAFEDWPQVIEVVGMQLGACDTDELRAQTLVRRAQLKLERTPDPQSAMDDYIQALGLQPQDEPIYKALRALLERYEAWSALFDVLQFRVQSTPEDKQRPLLLEMSQLADRMGDASRRIKALEALYAKTPEDLEIIQPLLDAYIATQRFDLAEPMLNEVIETLRAKRQLREVVGFLHLKGKLAEQKGQDQDAMAAYEEAHKIDATYLPNLLSLGKLAYRLEDFERARTLFQTMQLHQMHIKEDRMKIDMFYYLGMVRVQQGDTTRAIDMFKRVLRIDANHEPSKQALEQLG